jgi:hypothetical protein
VQRHDPRSRRRHAPQIRPCSPPVPSVINPVNRCLTVVVPVEEVERFRKQYVSLFALAKQGRHFLKVKQGLDAAGVKPALDPAKVGATFYRRRGVPRAGMLKPV